MTTQKRPALVAICTLAAMAAGCGPRMFVPTIEEEAALLANADLPGKRYAVVVRAAWTGGHVPAVEGFGNQVAAEVAEIATEMLGVEAIPLDHADGSPWPEEHSRFEADRGWLTASTYEPFFRNEGFDGYIMVTAQQEWFFRNTPEGRIDFHRYNPTFHVVDLPENSERVGIMTEGMSQTTGVACRLEGGIRRDYAGNIVSASPLRHPDLEDCTAKLSVRFRIAVGQRLSLSRD